MNPKLSVIQLSDSFADAWEGIAVQAGFEIMPGSDGSEGADVVVVSAAGVEDRLEAAIRSAAPAAGRPVVAVGALADHRVAAAAVRAGANDYFALPGDLSLFRAWLSAQAERLSHRANRAQFASSEKAKYTFEGILGDSASLREALAKASRVIPHGGVTVLITGETGTGKELLARAIHYNGPRREAAFVDVNCAAIPEQLLESELFGHEKGAFTGATSSKPGLFEVANGGTLFLDEIGHLPGLLQGKILRALQEKSIRRVGGTRPIQVDVRIVAATHVDLAASVARQEFREDLYYRLNVVPIELPPLRHRRDDILLLAHHFLAGFAKEYGIPDLHFSPAAERALLARDWPGNVRELRNAIERASLLANDGIISDVEFAEARRPTPTGGIPFPSTMSALQRAAAHEMVKQCSGNKSEAARRLGISRPRLQRLMDATSDGDLTEDGDA